MTDREKLEREMQNGLDAPADGRTIAILCADIAIAHAEKRVAEAVEAIEALAYWPGLRRNAEPHPFDQGYLLAVDHGLRALRELSESEGGPDA